MQTTTIVSLGLLLLMTGCIPSVHPLYTEQDLIFDPLLVGVWDGEDGKETWTFTRSGENAYTLRFVDGKGKAGEFSVHLLKVGDRRFLDLCPADPDLPQNDFYKFHLLPVHSFLRIRQQGDALQMTFLQPNWIRTHLQEHPDALKHEKVGDGILLTAQPGELQAFLLKHDQTPDAWDECSPLTRRVENPGQ